VLTDVDLFTLQILDAATPGTYNGNIFVPFGGTDPVACGNGTVGCDNQQAL
jgi:hypothetical protein